MIKMQFFQLESGPKRMNKTYANSISLTISFSVLKLILKLQINKLKK